MDLTGLRNTLREWFRDQVQDGSHPDLAALDLVVSNELSEHGVKDTYLRFSVQTGDAAVTGIGTELKRRTRVGRVFVEVFGPLGEGEGDVTELATEVEQIWRDAMVAANSPDPLIYVGEPSSFERPEAERYCQVVSVPFRADLLS